MSGVEILMVVAIVMQLIASAIAMLLVNRTKYRALCIIGIIIKVQIMNGGLKGYNILSNYMILLE